METQINKRLLIVDDEEDIIEFLKYNFRKKGFDVYGASNGVQAIKMIPDINPEVIITDIMMPKMDGIDLCRKIKENEKYKHIPVLFLSCSDDDYRVWSAMEAGGDDYISKPVVISIIIKMVEDLLGLKPKQEYSIAK